MAIPNLLDHDSTPLRSPDHDGLVLFLIEDSGGDCVTAKLGDCATRDRRRVLRSRNS